MNRPQKLLFIFPFQYPCTDQHRLLYIEDYWKFCFAWASRIPIYHKFCVYTCFPCLGKRTPLDNAHTQDLFHN